MHKKTEAKNLAKTPQFRFLNLVLPNSQKKHIPNCSHISSYTASQSHLFYVWIIPYDVGKEVFWMQAPPPFHQFYIWVRPTFKTWQVLLRWSTSVLFSSWLLDHVIYLKPRTKNMLLNLSKLKKIQIFSLKRTTFDHFEWK